MAQRKPSSAGKPAAKKGTSRPAGKPTSSSAARAGATKAPAARKPPPRKPGRSIVNQKQTPWGVIASVVAVVLFAGAVIAVVLVTHKSSNGNTASGKCGGANARYCLPELPAAKQIKGVTYHFEPNHTHVFHTVKYDTTPPTGGDHSQYWADCSDTVYPQPIANENAVHALEHGSVWVTYRQGLPASDVNTLAGDVRGAKDAAGDQSHVLMSPYPNLKTKVSLQAWGYQLFLNNVKDPRINQFIGALAGNPQITPELSGNQAISCSDPTFKAHPSTFGHPLFAPVSGSGGTMSAAP